MKKKYTRKQICEAIQYWKAELHKMRVIEHNRRLNENASNIKSPIKIETIWSPNYGSLWTVPAILVPKQFEQNPESYARQLGLSSNDQQICIIQRSDVMAAMQEYIEFNGPEVDDSSFCDPQYLKQHMNDFSTNVFIELVDRETLVDYLDTVGTQDDIDLNNCSTHELIDYAQHRSGEFNIEFSKFI